MVKQMAEPRLDRAGLIGRSWAVGMADVPVAAAERAPEATRFGGYHFLESTLLEGVDWTLPIGLKHANI
jgi:hypothetical protein